MTRGWRGAAAAALAVTVAALMPATASASRWTASRLPGPAGKSYLLGVSCPSRSLCVATGTNNLIASSTDPTGGATAWDYVYAGEGPWEKTNEWPTEDISGKQVQGVSCPSAKLCVAVTDQGFIYSSTNPTGPASAWKSIQIDSGTGRNTHLFGVSCPTATLCVAVSGKRADEGEIFSTANPTGDASAWRAVELGEPFEFRGVSCASTSLCVAVANDGRIVVSSEPSGEAWAWRAIGAPAGPGPLRGVSCVTPGLCAAGNQGGNLLFSTNPLAGAPAWSETNGGGSVQITGVSCTAASECLAVDNNGDAIASTNPSGGRSAWSFANILPFTAEEGNALFAASCPSAQLCVATGSRGRILTSTDPFAKPPQPSATGAGRGSGSRRGPRRPRVKIATVRLPFRREIAHHTARVLIRFFARGRVRGFSCRFDQRHWRRCHSPKRYRIGVGHHLFRVRATGVTGLKGPITSKRFTIDPLCEDVPPGKRHLCT
jgi:hypothetical protein